MAEHKVPIFGGVADGGEAIVPAAARPGFKRQVRNGEQLSSYTLRGAAGQRDTLVEDNVTRWPILEAAPA